MRTGDLSVGLLQQDCAHPSQLQELGILPGSPSQACFIRSPLDLPSMPGGAKGALDQAGSTKEPCWVRPKRCTAA